MTLQSLVEKITDKLDLRKERKETLECMVHSVIGQLNVNHHALIEKLQSGASLKSKLERIRRFFANQKIDQQLLAKAIIESSFSETPRMHIIVDRTNWKFGKKDINYLVLSVRIGKVVFPLFWSMLDHQGCSDTAARVTLMEQFRETFGFACVQSFSADREFIGDDWFTYLLDHNIPFFIRVKDNRLVEWGSQKKPLKDFFNHLNVGEHRFLFNAMKDSRINIVGKKIKDDYLVIVSNRQDAKHVLKTYQQRWDIERLFRNMKTQGFNIENTHMTDLERLKKLMAVLAIAIFSAYFFGLSIKCAYKKTVKAPLYSVFTRGLRALKHNVELLDLCISQNLIKSEG